MSEESNFSTSLPTPVTICLFYYNYTSGYEVVSPCDSDLHFLDDQIFSCAYRPFISLLWRNVCLNPLSIRDFLWIFEKDRVRQKQALNNVKMLWKQMIAQEKISTKVEKEEHFGVQGLEVKDWVQWPRTCKLEGEKAVVRVGNYWRISLKWCCRWSN